MLGKGVEERSFHPGEELIAHGEINPPLFLILGGSARLLAGSSESPVSLGLVREGEAVGWLPAATGLALDWVRASSEVSALRIGPQSLQSLFREFPAWKESLTWTLTPQELYPCLLHLLRMMGKPAAAARSLTPILLPHASLGDEGQDSDPSRLGIESSPGRRVTLPKDLLEEALSGIADKALSLGSFPAAGIGPGAPVSSSDPSSRDPGSDPLPSFSSSPPLHRASGPDEAVFACLRMMAGQLGIPFRKEVVRAALKFHLEGRPARSFSFPRIGSVADMIGIATQPLLLPTQALRDQEAPFLLLPKDAPPVVAQGIHHHSVLIADPVAGTQRWVPWSELPAPPGDPDRGYPILLARRSRVPRGEAFGFATFLPYIRKHTRTFVEVVIASVFIQVFALANPLIIQVIIDKVIVQESLGTLDVLAGLLVLTTVFGAALTAIRTFLFTDATNRIDLSLGMRVLEHLYRLPLSYFHQRPVGEIASRLRELDKIRGFLTGTALTAMLDALFSVAFVAIMLFYSAELTAIALIGVPLLVGLTLFVSPIVRRQLRDRAEKNAATESHLVESLTGIQTIKGQNAETRSRWKWFGHYGDTIASSFRNTITTTSSSTAGMLINRFNDVAVLWAGVYLVIDQKMTLGQLIAFRILAGYVTGPLLRLAQSWQGFQEAALSVNRLGDVANRAREDEDSGEQIPMPVISGRITCEGLDFGYAPGKNQLENISLQIPQGSLVAMVGLSGSGKSTLLKIIGRLYEPVKGSVEIDGFNLSKVELNSLRGQIGMVFQETLLMEGSVMDNITLSDPDASSDEVIEAARMAGAHDFIMTLPNGYASSVGEQGRNLSGGQRQRVALARLILQRPSLLLLDEATSALDAPTEARVIGNLRRRFEGKTILFATHRLSTVRMADHIYYLKDGLLAEHGTHEELMSKRGLYYSLSLQQEGSVA